MIWLDMSEMLSLRKSLYNNRDRGPCKKMNCKMAYAWEQRKLGELSSIFEYGLNAAAKEFDGKNKYIRITDIDDNTRMFLETDIASPDIPLDNAENDLLKEGDIVFARTGASVGKPIFISLLMG